MPVCPLCNKPIPLKKGEQPDVVVGRHIDSDCQSDPAKERRKVRRQKCDSHTSTNSIKRYSVLQPKLNSHSNLFFY